MLVAQDLTLTDLAHLPPGHVVGIALARSTPTAHSAILARSLGIPMACTLGDDVLNVIPGQPGVVDGNRGQLWVDLTPEELVHYHNSRRIALEQGETARLQAHAQAITEDSVLIPIYANVNSPEDVMQVAPAGADGVGLLRTEYLFRGRATPPTYTEQLETYTQFVRQVRGQLTVRALDAGGDKPVAYIRHRQEDNPFLGLRGIRLLIEQPELLRVQYRALQAAAIRAEGNVEVRFLLPMISTAEEIHIVRTLLSDLPDDYPHLPIGIMIEVPSAALIARALSPLVDFFSIGTNDLTQYVLASDRTNSDVARLVDPVHPAVLYLIKLTCEAGTAAQKPVSLCGEIAGDPAAVPLLLGLGVTELSVPLPSVALVKQTIRRWTMARCRGLAEQALNCQGAEAVRTLLLQNL